LLFLNQILSPSLPFASLRTLAEKPFAHGHVFFVYPAESLSASCLRCPLPASTRFASLSFSARHPPTLCFSAPGEPCLLKTRRKLFPLSPALSHKGRGDTCCSSCLTQTPGAYRSEHKRGRKSVYLIFSERTRQRTEISPRSARQCAKWLLQEVEARLLCSQ